MSDVLLQLAATIKARRSAAADSSYTRQLLDAGMAPEQIADTVFEAIRAKRFYVFPHPHSAERIRARMEGIAAERNPVALTVDVFK